MKWFQHETKNTKVFSELVATNNEKYGDYDYANDSRILDTEFENKLLEAVGDISGKHVLIVGANSGYEVNILANRFPSVLLEATDISDIALHKILENFPSIPTKQADMEKLPFEDKKFDVYVNCRAIQSSNVDMEIALKEAVRVTRERIVISVPNGYLIEGKIVNGMYDYVTEKIDEQKPFQVASVLRLFLENDGYSVENMSSLAELFLIGKPQENLI